MNREIKFRAFDKKENKMFHSLIGLHFDDVCCSATFLSNLGDEMTVRIDDLELMQYTGLKDYKGVDIYEGDVISTKHNREKDYQFEVKFSELNGEWCAICGDGYDAEYHRLSDIMDMEILIEGNIFKIKNYG